MTHTNAAYAETTEHLVNYSRQALTTAIYPERNEMGGVVYATLGLIGEVAETFDQFIMDPSADNLGGELGDTAWYINALADELGTSLPAIDVLAAHQEPDSNANFAEDFLGDLMIHSGAIANKLKKALRDDDGEMTTDRRAALINLLVKVWMDWNALVKYIDGAATVETILDQNLGKLFNRKERGVLGGDGDKR